MKDFKAKKPKASSQLLTLQQLEKVHAKARKEKKKDCCNQY